jgi:hypothetical protein
VVIVHCIHLKKSEITVINCHRISSATGRTRSLVICGYGSSTSDIIGNLVNSINNMIW